MGNAQNDHRKLIGREIFKLVFSSVVSVGLFFVLYFFINPRITVQEKLERHDAKITALEITVQQFSKIEDRVNKIYEYLLGVKP